MIQRTNMCWGCAWTQSGHWGMQASKSKGCCRDAQSIWVSALLVSPEGAGGDISFMPWHRGFCIPYHDEARKVSYCYPCSIWELHRVGEGRRREKMLLRTIGQVLVNSLNLSQFCLLSVSLKCSHVLNKSLKPFSLVKPITFCAAQLWSRRTVSLY